MMVCKAHGSVCSSSNKYFNDTDTLSSLEGLHFNPLGYRILYDEIRKVMAEAWPESQPDNLEKHFPDWGSWFKSPAIEGSEAQK